MPSPVFRAELADGEALLAFPYDERLRLLLRAIPGRRWDPERRVWCLPLGPEQAHALSCLLARMPDEAQVSAGLARRLRRLRRRRGRNGCVVDLVRPGDRPALGFATDGPADTVRALLSHPGAESLPAIGRGVLPLDARARELIARLSERAGALELGVAARRALEALARELRDGSDDIPGRPGAGGADARLGEGDLRAGRLERAPQPRPWRGTIEAGGVRGAPELLLLGDRALLAEPLRSETTPAPGGASLALDARAPELIRGLDAWITPAARRCLAAVAEGRPAPPAVLELSRAHELDAFVLAPGHDAACTAAFAALPGALAPRRPAGRAARTARALAHPRTAAGEHARLAALRADPFCVPPLDRFLAAHDVWVDPAALAVLQQVREEHAHGAGLVALSAAEDAPLHVAGLGGTLKPFQRAGVAYLLDRRRAFLADEQGLGKTIQALAALEADGAYPAVVVCPASLKLNWQREAEAWLPHRSVRALAGLGGPRDEPDTPADVTLVNYDIVAARLPGLTALSPRALILDESHYCKNALAKRTQAVRALAGAVPADGLVLALSGTPVPNRPAELVAQLRILSRLEDFGNGARFAERFQGPDANVRLHWHLRARCFARRLKADVLPQLPAKTRAIIPVELDNEPEYRLAERDLVAWLQSQPLDLAELDARVAAALRAERLVRIGALKLLAARGKLAAALRWVHDFSSSGEPLVLFARHREIQRAVLERFPDALHILGEDSPAQRDRALRAFQDPRAGGGLIVCSLEVAGHGITLTRASNVAFLELDWTPARHDQAEDRCHRIGQHDAVTAYYLLAAGTIDETVATLLERKRAVIGAVTDGRDEDEEGLVDALVRELRGVPYQGLRAVA